MILVQYSIYSVIICACIQLRYGASLVEWFASLAEKQCLLPRSTFKSHKVLRIIACEEAIQLSSATGWKNRPMTLIV